MVTDGVGASVAGSPGAIRAEVAELLGVSADTVDPDGNLISQGLDSIRMMALAGRWRRRGIAVDFAALAAAPTIEAWSLLVSAAQVNVPEPVDAAAAAATARRTRRRISARPDAARNVGRAPRHSAARRRGRASLCRIRRRGNRSRPAARSGHRLGDAASDAAGAVFVRWHPADRSGSGTPNFRSPFTTFAASPRMSSTQRLRRPSGSQVAPAA